MVVRSTLVTWEDGEVDGSLKVIQDLLAGFGIGASDSFAEEDHGSSRSTEGLVSGGGDDIGVFEGRRNDTRCDEAGDVSHIDNEIGAHFVGDLTHASIIDQPAVCGSSCDDALGTVHQCVLFEAVVVDDTGVEVDSVREGLEICRNGGNSSPPC